MLWWTFDDKLPILWYSGSNKTITSTKIARSDEEVTLLLLTRWSYCSYFAQGQNILCEMLLFLFLKLESLTMFKRMLRFNTILWSTISPVPSCLHNLHAATNNESDNLYGRIDCNLWHYYLIYHQVGTKWCYCSWSQRWKHVICCIWCLSFQY